NINTANWESSACFSADGKYLYFTSDKPGGFGGADIYRAEIDESGKYGNVTNLGSTINTEYDEDAPQIHSDGKTLFFSSKGHKGLGGFDVYSTVFHEDMGSWETPRNVGYPINTPDDDIYFSLLANGATGYFSSYRNDSYGEKDIYMITRPGSVPTRFLMKMNLIDPFSGNQINARITINNTRTGEKVFLDQNESQQGKYVIPLDFETEYIFAIEATGYRFKEKKIFIDYRADIFEYVMNILPSREEIITLVDSTQFVKAVQKINREEFIYEDEGFLNEMAETDAGETPEDTSTGNVPIGGIEAGETVIGENDSGKGDPAVLEKKKTTENNFPNVTEYEPESAVTGAGNQALTSYPKMDLELKSSRSKPLHDELVRSVQLSEDEQWIKQIMNNEDHVIFLTRLDNRNKMIVPVINFGFDDYSLREDYKKYLQKMAGFFNNSETTRILIAGHTDWIGTNEYNQTLSVNRAKQVRDYLMETGSPEYQLYIHGFGEDFPLLSNAEAWGRKVNRRASMMLVDIKDPRYQDAMYEDLLKLFGVNLAPEKGYQSPLIVWEKLPLSIHFPENESEGITRFSREKLQDLAVYLKKTPYSLVMIGFVDNNEEGDPGEQRAWLAYKYLKSLGIEDERLVLINRTEFSDFYDVSNMPDGVQRRKVQFFLVKH
ncbi:MAG: OmpA family protein, partial [Cyclobacteriaceae bacterium]|nr:OmpA family protein [Cyclobacteriaceae bacterium]